MGGECPRSLRFQAQVTGRTLCPPTVIGKSGGEEGVDRRRWGVEDVEVIWMVM